MHRCLLPLNWFELTVFTSFTVSTTLRFSCSGGSGDCLCVMLRDSVLRGNADSLGLVRRLWGLLWEGSSRNGAQVGRSATGQSLRTSRARRLRGTSFYRSESLLDPFIPILKSNVDDGADDLVVRIRLIVNEIMVGAGASFSAPFGICNLQIPKKEKAQRPTQTCPSRFP
jgi:hypothetical protein